MSILYFPIPHNARCLPPKFCIKLLLRNALGNMQTSQEYFTTIVYAKFEGANRVHYGQLENSELDELISQRELF